MTTKHSNQTNHADEDKAVDAMAIAPLFNQLTTITDGDSPRAGHAGHAVPIAPAAKPVRTPHHQPIVYELIGLLTSRPDLQEAVEQSLAKAQCQGAATLNEYYEFLDKMVTLIPTDRNLDAVLAQFYYLMDMSPKNLLQTDLAFQRWACDFAVDWGAYLDTPASAAGIATFLSDPKYHIGDYSLAPSGWLTFNQFFARHPRPGKRPIDAPSDDSIVVSPADSVYKGQWKIQANSTITVKGLTWSVFDLLNGSPHQERFKGGVFTHSFLDVNDYHRFHVPVAGTILEARKIPGRVIMDVAKRADGTLHTVDGTGYQFTQDRGLIVIDSPIGLVAVLPIGMAQVSSVNLTAQVGDVLVKGEEFGYFAFGGSDIVTLYEANRVHLDAKVGTHYNQGKRIGHR